MYFYTGLLALLFLLTTQSASAVTTEEAPSTTTTETTTTETTTAAESTTTETTTTTTTTPSTIDRTVSFVIYNENVNCTAADASTTGVLEIGCWGFKRCVNGRVVSSYCPYGYVFDRATFNCVKVGSGSTNCGSEINCTGKPLGRYPDVRSNCSSFYLCGFGALAARYYCPAELVFNEALQTCDYPRNVAPPCGTKTSGIAR